MTSLIQLFSFDVVGSAAFKSNASEQAGIPEWLGAFRSFFDEIPLIFTAEIAHTFFEEQGDFPEVSVWKAIGDEMVFIAYPEDINCLQLLTKAFASAMAKANQRFEQDWGLQIHGATWSFEEGTRNLAIRFRELEKQATTVMDLIGPDVDLGFRLVTHSPAGGVLIPLTHQQQLLGSTLQIRQIGQAHLKGIQLQPYPLLMVMP